MTTYYVRPTNGSDASAGTTFGTAFQTTQKALDTVAAGDEVRLCAEDIETVSAAIDADTTSGTGTSWITVTGANGDDGSDDGTVYTIQASGLGGSACLDISGTASITNYIWRNIIFDASSDANLGVTNDEANADEHTFINCRFTGGLTDGASTQSAHWTFEDCEFDSNASDGIFTNAFYTKLLGCEVHDNTTNGFNVSGQISVLDLCEVYDNGGNGVVYDSGGDNSDISNSTFYANDGDGIDIANGALNISIYNTTISNSGGYAVNAVGGDRNELKYYDYNHTHNNTSGASNITLPGYNNQTGDPQFTSVVDGSEDFIPANGSPLDSNGINGTDIGARKAADPAGGAGGCNIVIGG